MDVGLEKSELGVRADDATRRLNHVARLELSQAFWKAHSYSQ